MKTERITILGSPQFKAFLAAEAEREGVSVSELVRRRCLQAQSEDEEVLARMAAELSLAVTQARLSLEEGLRSVHEALDAAGLPPEEQAA